MASNFHSDLMVLQNCIARKSKHNPNGLTKPQLIDIARSYGISTSGNKKDLCERIISIRREQQIHELRAERTTLGIRPKPKPKVGPKPKPKPKIGAKLRLKPGPRGSMRYGLGGSVASGAIGAIGASGTGADLPASGAGADLPASGAGADLPASGAGAGTITGAGSEAVDEMTKCPTLDSMLLKTDGKNQLFYEYEEQMPSDTSRGKLLGKGTYGMVNMLRNKSLDGDTIVSKSMETDDLQSILTEIATH